MADATVAEIRARVAKTVVNMDLIDSYVNGDASTVVMTEFGPASSILKQLTDFAAAPPAGWIEPLRGQPGNSLTPRGVWATGVSYGPRDYVVAVNASALNSIFVRITNDTFTSTTQPKDDATHWKELNLAAYDPGYVPLNKAGDIAAAPINVTKASGDVIQAMSGAAGSQRGMLARTGSSTRWVWGANGAAETGTNLGSDWELNCYDDAGVFQSTALKAIRKTGKVGVGGTPTWIAANFDNIADVGRFQAVSLEGYAALTAFTNANDNGNNGSQGAYAFGAFVVQNSAASRNIDAYAVYSEGKRTSGSGTLSTVEIALRNQGTEVLLSPYQSGLSGVTSTLRISTLSGNHVSAAILIYGGLSDGGGEPVGAQFVRGIVFKHGSIVTGLALDMAAEHRLLWSNAGTAISQITATAVGSSLYPFAEAWFTKYAIGGVLKTLSIDGGGFVKAA